MRAHHRGLLPGVSHGLLQASLGLDCCLFSLLCPRALYRERGLQVTHLQNMIQQLMAPPNVSVMPCQLQRQGLRAAPTPIPHIVQLWIVSISSPARDRPTLRHGRPRVPTKDCRALSSLQSLDRGTGVVLLPGSSEGAPSHGGAHEQPEIPSAPRALTDSTSRRRVHSTS